MSESAARKQGADVTSESEYPALAEGAAEGLPPTIRRRVVLSWISLSAERLWPVTWPAGGVVGVFLILALANAFAYVPEWLHLISLLLFAAAIAASVFWSLRQTSVPTRAQAVRHLERASGLEHRPLSALEDKPASGNDDTRYLWRAHRRWIVKHLNQLKVAWPALSLAARDPHALRILLFLILAALTIANWSEVPGRLVAAISPGWAQGNAPASFEAWVTPPAYTGQAPRHLTASTRTADSEVAVKVPVGSELTVRTHGDTSAVLRIGALGGSVPDQQRPEFLPAGGDARDAKLAINKDMTVRLSLSASQAAEWRFQVVPDAPPRIDFKTPLAVTQSRSLRFNYVVRDDYGVAIATAAIALDRAGTRAKAPPQPMVFELPLPPAPARHGDATIFKDLTAHVWAGLPVVVTLTAKDERGQIARSRSARITLPERQFNDPLARALIEQRRSLARDPASAPLVAKALDALSIAPERFMPDTRSYLALRTTYFLVARARGQSEIATAQQLLWDLALRIEEGDAPQAQAELRAVQQRLMEALANGASDQEIERLLAQLRQAIERVAKATAERAQHYPNLPVDPNLRLLRPQDLQAMLESIENLARQGSRAAAQQMLAQLQNMLENLQMSGAGQMSAAQKAATDALEKLGSMIAEQRGLLDKTFREQRAKEEGPGRPGKSPKLQGEQKSLADKLAAVMKQIGRSGKVPEALMRAERAMKNAADDLGEGQYGPASDNQQKAIDELRRGGEAVARELLKQMAGRAGALPGEGPGAGENEDPFGRPQASYGPSFGDSVRVPDKLDIQKAREILEELQRRAAERGRPAFELEYIDRLLRRF